MMSIKTINRKNDAWSIISPPEEHGTETVRRADTSHDLDFFRGRDYQGRYLFMFRVTDPSREDVKLPNLQSIEVVFEPVSGAIWQLKLILQDSQHIDIFGILCANLMEATRGIASNRASDAVPIVVTRLSRWQLLLKQGRSELLPESSQIGLFGELTFIRDVLCSRISIAEAISCWRGPYGDEQDFAVFGILVEIKSQRETSDRQLNISSADQLDTRSGPIVLCHQRISVVDDDVQTSTSLGGLASQLLAMADEDDPATGDLLRSALHEVGFEVRAEYETPARMVRSRDFYEVTDEFPRVTPDMFLPGVSMVTYALDISACGSFSIEEDTIWRNLNHAS